MRDLAVPIAASFQARGRRLRRSIPAYVKGVLRRQAGYLLPSREAREYQAWMTRHMEARRTLYTDSPERGLLSVLTPVWDGSPLRYLKTLAGSIVGQNRQGTCEWVILDNGSSSKWLLSYLEELRQHRWIKLLRVEKNRGIIGGLRYCLERAEGRYALPVDADDFLYTDAFRVITSYIHRAGYPPLLYTDEDKITGDRTYQPYLKPDWDPVLFLNSAYIAHLGILDREKALALGAYSDPATEGSPDWDLFVRFMLAGYTPEHIPEVVYSWRSHARSTADDAATKPYIPASQRAVLQRFLDGRPDAANFCLEQSPLLPKPAHWHFARRREHARPFASVVIGDVNASTRPAPQEHFPAASHPRVVLPLARELAREGGFVCFRGADVEIEAEDWKWETLGIFELHPDTVMIGGRIRTTSGVITEAGRYFGFQGVCGCPHRGRPFLDCGYFMQMWKQRSVSAVSTQFAVMDAKFLVELIEASAPEMTLGFLGAWAGARAFRKAKRVVYSPFLSGISDFDWETHVAAAEQSLFVQMNRDLLPDSRFYSRYLSLEEPFALEHGQLAKRASA